MTTTDAKALAIRFGNKSQYNHLLNVKPVQVTIHYKGKPETFYGISYTQQYAYSEGMRIVQEGTVKAGDIYTEDRIMLLGDLPRSYKDKVRIGGYYEQKNHYQVGNENRHWYVICHYSENQTSEHHPLGKNFILGTCEPGLLGEKIILKMEITDTE